MRQWTSMTDTRWRTSGKSGACEGMLATNTAGTGRFCCLSVMFAGPRSRRCRQRHWRCITFKVPAKASAMHYVHGAGKGIGDACHAATPTRVRASLPYAGP
eukprot:351122-Chlamydomonas_euryale.AAC.2